MRSVRRRQNKYPIGSRRHMQRRRLFSHPSKRRSSTKWRRNVANTCGTNHLSFRRGCRSPLWVWFVALFVRPGCLAHLIVLRFADAFFDKLGTLAPSLGIFIFSEGVCCLPPGRSRHGLPTLRFASRFTNIF